MDPGAPPHRPVAAAHAVRREVLRADAPAGPEPATAELLIAVARRLRGFVDTLRAAVDGVDPDGPSRARLRQLAEVDDRAARVARYCDGLLALAGAPVGGARPEPVSILSAIAAASSTVEQSTRVALGVVDGDITLRGTACGAIVHVLAELLDNATSFSPPGTVVTVSAWRVGGQAVVRITDQGVGIPARRIARLNLMLAGRPPEPVEAARASGLAAVGALSRRLRLTVRLSTSTGSGTVAEVGIPSNLLLASVWSSGDDPHSPDRVPVPPSGALAEVTRLLHVPPDL